MLPTAIERYHKALSAHYSLLATRFHEGAAEEGPGLLFMLVPDASAAPFDPAHVRFVSRLTWTEYVLSTQHEAELSQLATAIEMVARAIEGTRVPLALPVAIVRGEEGEVDVALIIVERPAGAALPLLPPLN